MNFKTAIFISLPILCIVSFVWFVLASARTTDMKLIVTRAHRLNTLIFKSGPGPSKKLGSRYTIGFSKPETSFHSVSGSSYFVAASRDFDATLILFRANKECGRVKIVVHDEKDKDFPVSCVAH